jgi:hypothetical protein
VVQSVLVAVTAVRIRSFAIAELFGDKGLVTKEQMADFKTNVTVSFAPLTLSVEGASGKRAAYPLVRTHDREEDRFWPLGSVGRSRGGGCRCPDRAENAQHHDPQRRDHRGVSAI